MNGAAATGLPLELALGRAGHYFDGTDHLRLTSWNALAAVALTITGRFLHVSGEIEAFSERHVPNTDRTAATLRLPRAHGWLLDLSVVASAGAPIRGQTFVRVDVVRGLGATDVVLSTLLRGYVTAQQRLGWPGAAQEDPLDGQGALRSVAGSNPAAGAEIDETVPTGARWRLHALRFTLVADANAANREVAIVITDGTNTLLSSPSAFSHTATLTRAYTGAPFGAATAPAQGTDRQILLPPLTLLAGWHMTTVTTNVQAGDDYAAPRLLVEEHLEAA